MKIITYKFLNRITNASEQNFYVNTPESSEIKEIDKYLDEESRNHLTHS